MAQELRSFEVTIPAGTLAASPLRQQLAMPTRQVDTIEIIVPPGPSGFMSFAITMGGVNVFPIQPGKFITTDDERIVWPVTGQPTSGAWELTGYNTDVFDHTVYLRFLLDAVSGASVPSLLENVSLTDLSNAGS